MTNRRQFLQGAAGFIGPHQIEHALARGHEVAMFNRGNKSGLTVPTRVCSRRILASGIAPRGASESAEICDFRSPS